MSRRSLFGAPRGPMGPEPVMPAKWTQGTAQTVGVQTKTACVTESLPANCNFTVKGRLFGYDVTNRQLVAEAEIDSKGAIIAGVMSFVGALGTTLSFVANSVLALQGCVAGWIDAGAQQVGLTVTGVLGRTVNWRGDITLRVLA